MPQGNPRPGERYLHFKEKLYQVITIAEHTETEETLVVYQALYGNFQIYARPFSMFTSKVDKEKYPDVQQEYRFALAQQQTESAERSPTGVNTGTRKAEDRLMAFFDAETMEEKYRILLEMRDDIDDHMINNMAVVLDVVIEEGPLDRRYEELKTCVRTFQRYECSRLR
ncbi:MAG: DUF1653 domain-containing protein [Lachnospiraceae bacterium]|nr:DUF1653 domain-containing protein [Lachnospiraceae bacterium]